MEFKPTTKNWCTITYKTLTMVTYSLFVRILSSFDVPPESHGAATSDAIGLPLVSQQRKLPRHAGFLPVQQVLIHDPGCSGDKGREETVCSMFRRAWSGRVFEETMALPHRRWKRQGQESTLQISMLATQDWWCALGDSACPHSFGVYPCLALHPGAVLGLARAW